MNADRGSKMLRHILALIFAGFITAASAAPSTTQPNVSNLLTQCLANVPVVGNGAGVSPICHASGALGVLAFTTPGSGVAVALANNLNATGGVVSPIPTRAGDVIYWNGSAWVTLAGNNSGTQFFSENSSGIPSWATVSGTGTVTSVTCNNGLDGGTFTTIGTCSLSAARRTARSIQKFLTASSSGTYTTPANVLSIDLEMVGAGGGGEGSGTTHGNGGTGGNTCWNTTGAACTTPLYQASGGAGGATTSGGAGGNAVGGSASCDQAITGGTGSPSNAALTTSVGSNGGTNPLGGMGTGGPPGGAGAGGIANTGAGGGGGSTNGTAGPGAGGGAGGYCVVHISAPAATYTWATGAGGTAGTAGTGGVAGGAGGTPGIWVRENYNIN